MLHNSIAGSYIQLNTGDKFYVSEITGYIEKL